MNEPIETTGSFFDNFDLPDSGNSTGGFLETFQNFAMQNLLIVGILAAATLLIVLYGIYRKKKLGPKPMDQQRWGLFEIGCTIMTIALIGSDVYAMHNMFVDFGLDYQEHWFYSITCAMFLEGFAIILGQITPELHDPVQCIRGRKWELRRRAWLCWLGLIASWAAVIYIRILFTYPIGTNETIILAGDSLIERIKATKDIPLSELFFGGMSAYLADDYGDYDSLTYLAQVFLYVSPVLTSLLAYAISLTAFGKKSINMAAKLLHNSTERLDWCEQRHDEAEREYEKAMRGLWSALGGTPEQLRTEDLEEFRRSCQVLIHDNIIDECITAYPSLLKRFNQEIESSMAKYIAKMGKHSTVPHLIGKLTVENIVQQYDDGVELNVDKWDYEKCGPIMAGDLQKMLHKAIIMAECRKISNY